MSITFPRTDLFAGIKIASQPQFEPVPYQETSTQASGVVRGKDLGPALWTTEIVTSTISNDRVVTFKARLASLDGVIGVFELGDTRRPYPLAHADGGFTDSGALAQVNGAAIALKNLPPGFHLSEGDYLAFDYGGSRALHQVMEDITASGAGLTGLFEVRPHVRPGYALDTAVTLKQPKARFTLVKGSISTAEKGTLWAAVGFKAVQYL